MEDVRTHLSRLAGTLKVTFLMLVIDEPAYEAAGADGNFTSYDRSYPTFLVRCSFTSRNGNRSR